MSNFDAACPPSLTLVYHRLDEMTTRLQEVQEMMLGVEQGVVEVQMRVSNKLLLWCVYCCRLKADHLLLEQAIAEAREDALLHLEVVVVVEQRGMSIFQAITGKDHRHHTETGEIRVDQLTVRQVSSSGLLSTTGFHLPSSVLS
jgi:hypothetical protein